MGDEKPAVRGEADPEEETEDQGTSGAGRPAGDSSQEGYSSTAPPSDEPDPSGGPGGG
jgi:hypothetical protein